MADLKKLFPSRAIYIIPKSSEKFLVSMAKSYLDVSILVDISNVSLEAVKAVSDIADHVFNQATADFIFIRLEFFLL